MKCRLRKVSLILLTATLFYSIFARKKIFYGENIQ